MYVRMQLHNSIIAELAIIIINGKMNDTNLTPTDMAILPFNFTN